jgi:predicted GNAT family N-acyltransferase
MAYTFTTNSHPPAVLENTTTLLYPTPANPNPSTNHPVFTHAMTVRHDVFVNEQNCAADAERDEDDARSWEFVIYAKPQGEHAQEEMKEEEEKPVAVVRLVPPPHAPHDTLHDPARASEFPRFDTVHEPYVKVTRVAVLKEFRGLGLAGKVMRVAEEWAAANKEAIDAMYRRVAGDIQQQPKGWNGLVGLHAQVQVEKMYQRMGYEKDGSLGTWDEEGIQHVGMFKRVALN